MEEIVGGIVEAAIVLAVGTMATLQFRAAGERARLKEQLKHVPTEKEVTDEIAMTRHQMRNEIQAATAKIEALIAKHHNNRGTR